jgi:hypothetical protein
MTTEIDFDDIETRLAMEEFMAFMDLLLEDVENNKPGTAADSADKQNE